MGFGSKMLRSRSNSLFGRSQPVSYEPSMAYDHPSRGMGGGMGGGMSEYGGAPYHPSGSSYAPSQYGGGPGYSQGYGPESRGYPSTTPYMGGGGLAFPSMDGPGSEMALIPSGGRSRSRRNSLASSMFPPAPGMVDDHDPYDTVPPPPGSVHTTMSMSRSRRNSFGGGGILPPGQDMYGEGGHSSRSRANSQYGGIVPGGGYSSSEYGYDERNRSGYRSRRGSQSGHGYYGSDMEDEMPVRFGGQRTGMYYSGGVMKRIGFFNRRGDQLWDNDGSYKPAHPAEQFPPDLASYPIHGWMDETDVSRKALIVSSTRALGGGERSWGWRNGPLMDGWDKFMSEEELFDDMLDENGLQDTTMSPYLGTNRVVRVGPNLVRLR